MGLRVWITRAQPGAQATAERLAAMGHEAVIAPLLVVRAVEAQVDLEGVAALAFTSANGVEAFARLCADRSLPAFAVGEATAQAARDAGFLQVQSADGDVGALGAMIAAASIDGAVLAPGARERAGDLPSAVPLTVYETIDCAPPADFDPESVDVVLVHSPKAGRALAAFLADHPAPDLEAACISLAAAAPLAVTPLAALDAAAEPNEIALLSQLVGRG